MRVIKYVKTAIGWYNFEDSAFKYNVNPEIFLEVTGVSDKATIGTAEITAEELDEIKKYAKVVGLATGWEFVQSDVI